MTVDEQTWDPPTSHISRQTNGQPQAPEDHHVNVGGNERMVSLAAGSVLALLGISRRSLPGLIVAGVGGSLIYRGATGHCPLYQSLSIDSARESTATPDYHQHGIHVTQSYIIDKPASELYHYWRNFENLPRIMSHLESVRVMDEKRSHWIAKAPSIAGGTVEWDAEIINDEPDALIAWRSLPGAQVDNAGSVRFVPRSHDRGTQLSIVIDYIPPAGRLGKWVATLFGQEPTQQIQEDLRKFKRIMETGEAATIQGQPKGTCGGMGKRHQGV